MLRYFPCCLSDTPPPNSINMGNGYSVVQEEQEEAEFRRLLADVERAERLRYGPNGHPQDLTTTTPRENGRSERYNDDGRNLGAFHSLTGVYDQVRPQRTTQAFVYGQSRSLTYPDGLV